MIAKGSPPWYVTAFGPHYPLVYAHRDYHEASLSLATLRRMASLGSGPILDLGCGQGRHLKLLWEQGLSVFGLDRSLPLLAETRRSAPRIPLMRADMRHLPLRSKMFSAVLSLFTTFGYFGPACQHRPLMSEIARVLCGGGHWFLDFLDSERVAAELADGPRHQSRDLGVLRVHEQRHLAVKPRRVVKTVRLEATPGHLDEARALGVGQQGLRYVEEVTLLSMPEIVSLTAAVGLCQVGAAGDYQGGPLVPGASDRWLLVFALNDREGRRA